MDDETVRAWDAWVRRHIDAAIEEHREVMMQAVGEVLSHDRGAMRDHVATEVKKLRSEIAELRSIIVRQSFKRAAA